MFFIQKKKNKMKRVRATRNNKKKLWWTGEKLQLFLTTRARESKRIYLEKKNHVDVMNTFTKTQNASSAIGVKSDACWFYFQWLIETKKPNIKIHSHRNTFDCFLRRTQKLHHVILSLWRKTKTDWKQHTL